ncbi:Imm30 family immunity protein [Priestia koreensis]|uniref:Imm30 family immunity protein n=1 Tax=Priestia koreensis TaxID=284581 RepID=UPI0034587CC6
MLFELIQLKENRLLRNEHEIESFEKAIANILDKKDVHHIEILCQGFDDLTENDEIMFGLIHAIESYDHIASSDVSLKKFAESIPSILPHAEEWVKVFHKRILNHEPSKNCYKRIIPHLNNEIQTCIVHQLNRIKEKNPSRFEASVNSILEFSSAKR